MSKLHEPTEEEYLSWGVKKPTPARIKCLGRGEEHYFISPDPTKIRICDSCKNRAGQVWSSTEMRANLLLGG